MDPANLRDSRRITGLHPYCDHPGAILELEVPPEHQSRVIDAWWTVATEITAAVGWGGTPLHARRHPDGVSLILEAPIDALYAATEVNELAWRLAAVALNGGEGQDVDAELAALNATIDSESRPALLDLHDAAADYGKGFLVDDETVSVGHGAGCRSYPADAPPQADAVEWTSVSDVPVALVTGTNGKSTTVRMLAAIVKAAGKVPGLSSTDWIRVGDEVLDTGDYSGPGGARAILRDERVEVALLETARGGMFRRGLGVEVADVACVLNVTEDHLGEWGCWTVEDLAEIKFTVTHAVEHTGLVVLNADDPLVRERAATVHAPIVWFSLEGLDGLPEAWRQACVLEGDELSLHRRDGRTVVTTTDRVPSTLGGAARHNVANALAAIAIADGLGLPGEAIAAGLAEFGRDPADNPGRLNVFELGGATAIVDFAHNPAGQAAVLEMAARMEAERRLVVLGQAGDRDDASVTDLCRITWQHRPERILIKAMEKYLRGLEPGVMTAKIEAELRAAGAPDEVIAQGGEEFECVLEALRWAQPGDLLLLFAHAERERTMEYLGQLVEAGWAPGSEFVEPA